MSEPVDCLYRKFFKEITQDIDQLWTKQGKPVTQKTPQPQEDRLRVLRARLEELYQKQEHYRRLHNEVVGQLTNISHGLPDWVFDYEVPANNEQSVEVYQEEAEEQPEHEEESDDNLLSPEMLQFMLQTYKHREERDRKKALEEARAVKFPPPLVERDGEIDPDTLSKRVQLESEIENYYENVSEVRNAPFWPVLPLRQLRR